MNSACTLKRKPVGCNIHINQRGTNKKKGEHGQDQVRLGNTRYDIVFC